MVALVGGSGGGKSTRVDLVTRLIDPGMGEILIDNVNLKEFDLLSYHAKIGVVSQETFLFNDSVLNNICHGSRDVSLPRAIEAAKIANAHEFISSFPDRYNTTLGDRGVKLSDGQRQRISLARALYKDPEELILDEATSALDSESEMVIQNAIPKIKHKYTTIVIAHRLSTIRDADEIIVLENGRVIENGDHNDLLSRNGSYTKYYNLQNEHSSLAV